MAVDPIDAAKLSDRELLLILHERVGTLTRDVHELKDGTSQKIATLEAKVENLTNVKADKLTTEGAFQRIADANDIRTKQINRLNQYVWFAFGALGVLQIVLTVIMKFGLPR